MRQVLHALLLVVTLQILDRSYYDILCNDLLI